MTIINGEKVPTLKFKSNKDGVVMRRDIYERGLVVGEALFYEDGTSQNFYYTQEKINELAVKPSHYHKEGLECIQVIKAITSDHSGEEGFKMGNIIKYLWRWKQKNGIEDLKKAREYLNQMIEKEENK